MKALFLIASVTIFSQHSWANEQNKPDKISCQQAIGTALKWEYGKTDRWVLAQESHSISKTDFEQTLSTGKFKPVPTKWSLNGQEYEIGKAESPYNDTWGSGWHHQQHIILKNVSTGDVTVVSPEYGVIKDFEMYSDGEKVLTKAKLDGGTDIKSGWDQPDVDVYAMTDLDLPHPRVVKARMNREAQKEAEARQLKARQMAEREIEAKRETEETLVKPSVDELAPRISIVRRRKATPEPPRELSSLEKMLNEGATAKGSSAMPTERLEAPKHVEWKYDGEDKLWRNHDRSHIQKTQFEQLLATGQFKPVEGNTIRLKDREYEIGIADDPYNDGWGTGWSPQKHIVLKSKTDGGIIVISPQYGSVKGMQLYTDGTRFVIKTRHERRNIEWDEPDFDGYGVSIIEEKK